MGLLSGINLSGITNLGNDIAVLEKWGPAIVELEAGVPVAIPIPAESVSIPLGSIGTLEISSPATTITVQKLPTTVTLVPPKNPEPPPTGKTA